MMRVCVDIDGCCFPWTVAVNDAVASEFGITGLQPDHPSWNYLHDQLDDEQWRWVWSPEAVRKIFARNDLIYPYVAGIVNGLAEEHDIHFVTHRNPLTTAGVTADWLEHHFRGYIGVHVLDSATSKLTLGSWDLAIDDKPETVKLFREEGIPCLVPARAYNREISDRFESWLEVPKLVRFFDGVEADL